MTLPDSELTQLQRRIRSLERKIADLKQPEIGRQMIAEGFAWVTTQQYYNDNNAHTICSTTLTAPAGSLLIAELNWDFDIRFNGTGHTGHTLRLKATQGVDTWNYCHKFVYPIRQNATNRQNAYHIHRIEYDTETAVTIWGEAQNWDYTISYLYLWSTWSRLFWRLYV